MTFEPGGDANIPKQTPVPGPTSADSREGAATGAKSAAERRNVMVRMAMVNSVLFIGALLAVFVFEVVDLDTGVWLIAGVAVFTGLYMVLTALRLQRAAVGGRTPHASTSHRGALAQEGPSTTGSSTETADLRFEIGGSFDITGRGTVVTGYVTEGTAVVGQEVAIMRDSAAVTRTTIGAIEMFRRKQEVATPGEQAGLLLPQVARSEVGAGDILIDLSRAKQ